MKASKSNTRTKNCMLFTIIAVCALCLSACTKMDDDYKTNTTQKGIIIVNPDKIVK